MHVPICPNVAKLQINKLKLSETINVILVTLFKCYLGAKFAFRARIIVFLIYFPN